MNKSSGRGSILTAGVLLLCFSTGAVAAECVVLLHGLARSASSFNAMEQALQEDGYRTANIDYPSRDHEIAELASMAVEDGLAGCRAQDGVKVIHFVTQYRKFVSAITVLVKRNIRFLSCKI